MEKTLPSFARRLWPELESKDPTERATGLFDLVGSLYSVPLTAVGLAWLIAVTDPAVVRAEWLMLLLLFALKFLFEHFDFSLSYETASGARLTWQSSLGTVVIWSAVLTYGPSALWLFVAWWTIWFVRNWLRSESTTDRWHYTRNLSFNLACTTFASLVALLLYERWIGDTSTSVYPMQSLTSGTVLPALGATLVWWLLSTLVWLPLFAYRARVQLLGAHSPRSYLVFWAITSGSHLLADPFAILAASLYTQTGQLGYLFFILGLLLSSILANRLSRATTRFQQRSRELELANERLQKAIVVREHSERLQSALYRIAAVANSEITLDELFRSIHEIVGELMHAKNFYIALYDADEDLLRFPYFVDEVDARPTTPQKPGKGLTEYIIKTGQPLLITQDMHDKLILQGELELVGSPSPIWLGVPLKSKTGTFGAMVVQHYTDHAAYEERERQVLTFVSGQVATAIERKQAEEKLQQYADELSAAVTRLEELDRLKNEFIQNVSHELRSPLALIRGYAELLSTGELGELAPQQQGPAKIITRRSLMLTSLVEDMTLMLKAESHTPEWELISLDELTRAAIEEFKVMADQAQLDLRLEVAADLPDVRGHPLYIRRVLDNLLSNAIKFTPANGSVVLRACTQDDQVLLQVSDTGIGIPPEQQKRIFERFYQVDGSTRRRYGGVGLGLALVKEIIELHGGQVAVESEPGEGTTFTVRLPIP